MIKRAVGSAVWLDKDNHSDYEPYCVYADFKAYCKGKNGHYYLVERYYGGMYVIRLQRSTQIREEEINLSTEDSNYFYDLKEPSDEALARFEQAVAKHKPYRMKVRNKDMQRHRCYAWEAGFGNDSAGKVQAIALTYEDAVVLSRKIADEAGIKSPTFSKGTTGTSWARNWTHVKYRLYSDKVSNKTVIHEMAHIIDSAKQGWTNKEPGHGPKFVGIYIKLLVKYMQYDIKYLEEKAREYKVKFEYQD